MLKLYHALTKRAEKTLTQILEKRVLRGKEDETRLGERKGFASRKRPQTPLIWLHGASVGEAQSALILIKALLNKHQNIHILVTTGTKTSAALMEKNLPERAFHQYYPLDHPDWVDQFLDHWRPDLALWMESEIWPNMLMGIKRRAIPAALINARLSRKSYKYWRLAGNAAKHLLSSFSLILAQTEQAASYFEALGAQKVIYTDNIKYSAAPLSCDEKDLAQFNAHVRARPLWLFASTHAGEEEMAARVHEILKANIPDVLSVIVPRHPERGAAIHDLLKSSGLNSLMRGEEKALPTADTDIYIANTLGELGLFYRAAPIACIGRSFSDDGGGGHNPVEAAQLNCAVLHGPNVQNLEDIYDEMDSAMAALQCDDEHALVSHLQRLISEPNALLQQQKYGTKFAQDKNKVLMRVMQALTPILVESGISGDAATEKAS